MTETTKGLQLGMESSEHWCRHSSNLHPFSSLSFQVQLPYLNARAARLVGAAGFRALGTASKYQAAIPGQQGWVPVKTSAQHVPLRRFNRKPYFFATIEAHYLARSMASIGVVGEEVGRAVQRAALVHGIVVHISGELAFLGLLVQHPPAIRRGVINLRSHVHLQNSVARGQNFVFSGRARTIHRTDDCVVAVMNERGKLAEHARERIAHSHHEVVFHMAGYAQQPSSAGAGDLKLRWYERVERQSEPSVQPHVVHSRFPIIVIVEQRPTLARLCRGSQARQHLFDVAGRQNFIPALSYHTVPQEVQHRSDGVMLEV